MTNQKEVVEEVEVVDAELVDSSVPTIQTPIAELSVIPTMNETSSFQLVLQDIPAHVHKADTLLAQYRDDPSTFLDKVSEEELDEQLKEMETVAKFTRDIDKSRKEMKKYMNEVRDHVMNTLDKRLEDASYSRLEQAQNDIRQLKKDIISDRRESRWTELRPTFEANVTRYPLIGELAPEMADFSRFKLMNPKLVSGAKTRNIREADHAFINETVYGWNVALELIKSNDWGLSITDMNALLTIFKQQPTVERVREEGDRMKENAVRQEKARQEAEKARREAEEKARIERQKREAELQKIEAERKRAQELQNKEAERLAVERQQQLQKEAQLQIEREKEREALFQSQFNDFNSQYRTIFKESFPEFIQYLFSNPNYHDIHNSPKTKAAVIYDAMRQVEQPDSVVSRETGLDPVKVLDLVRYILDA